MERLLSASQELSRKVDSNESAANELLQQCEVLQHKIKGMIQYQSVVQEIIGAEGHPRGPPRIEFSYIRQLQQDNAELRSLLEEHQAALDTIMRKYREQMAMFMRSQVTESPSAQDEMAEEVRSRTDQVYHMAAVMYEAARTEDQSTQHSSERLSQLDYENRYLRELLSLSSAPQPREDQDAVPPSNEAASDSRSSTPHIDHSSQ